MIGDVLSIEMRGEAAQLQKTLDQTNERAKELRKTIKAIELDGGKGSENWQKYKNELKEAEEQAKKLSRELKQMNVADMTIRQLEQHAKDLAKELKNADRSSQDFAKNAKRLGEVEKELEKAKKQAADLKGHGEDLGKPGLWGKISTGVKSVGTAFQAIMALAVLQWIYDIGKAIFDTTAKFEKYEKVLTTALGDQKLAKQSLEAIKKMAAETAFSVDELTDGYVKMVNRGLRPSQKEMVALADLAASQGKTFDQLVEGLLDASTAEFERLKEFGTRASKAGEEISFKFKDASLVIKDTGSGFDVMDKTTKKVVNTFKNQEDATLAVMTALGQMQGVAGQNAEMMSTLDGRTSNLGDSFDSLMVELGTGLRPVFIAILNLIQASIPVLGFLGKSIGTVSLIAKSFVMGLVDTVANAGKAIWSLGEAGVEFLKGNMSGAKTLLKEAQDSGSKALGAFKDNAKQGVQEISNMWVNPDGAIKAEFAGKLQGQKYQGELTNEQKKGIEKREKATQKTLEMIAQLEAENAQLVAKDSLETEQAKIDEKRRKRLKEVNDSLADEATKEQARALINKNADAQIHAIRQKDNEKALELLAQLEAEHDQKVADNSLEVEESKIREKQRKRLRDIEASKADENVKTQAIEAINRNAEAELEKVRTEYRQKRLKADAEAAEKRLEAENYIRQQEQQAEKALFDWQELQARGNATRLAAIKKARVDAELRHTQDKLQAEMVAEQAKATKDIEDAELLARTLNAVEARYHQESVAAEAKAAEEKKKIDADLHDQKIAKMKGYSDMFGALLRGDVNAFMDGASKIVQGHKAAWQERISKDMEMYQMGADLAMQAVNFLNDLAQRKAERHIALAKQEYDQKMAMLTTEMAVTESLITSTSNNVQNIKAAETARLTELQRILSSETATEEEKRQALKAFYSQQLQDMKAAEEAKIADLQRLANLAKTEDEKRAIEEKIKLAEQERDAKIAAAEKELEAKKASIDELTTFTTETTEAVLAEAQDASDKQVKMAQDEADLKVQNKVDLEETMAEEDRKFREKEKTEKKKAWEAQKKADIATALITGALAILKALANFFPLNIVMAAVAGAATAVQIGKIKNQPEPVFESGGFVAQGGRHGSRYGDGGIALIDRASGREVGEMEGDEAIISARQTAANWPIIQRMFKNARTPGKGDAPVVPLAFRDGGRFESPYFERSMYLFGAKKKKREAEDAAKMAELEAKKAQEEAEAAMAGASAGGEGFDFNSAEAQGAYEESRAQGEKQLELLQEIIDSIDQNGELLLRLGMSVISSKDELKGSLGSVEGAVRSVEGAVNAANTQGKFDALIGAISSMKADG